MATLKVMVGFSAFLLQIFNRFAVGFLFAMLTSHYMRGYSYLIPSGLPGFRRGINNDRKFALRHSITCEVVPI